MDYKLLLVDDDRDVVENLSRRLQAEGYRVETAHDGQEALQKVATANPDVIILDLMLPKLNGFEVLKEVREKHKGKWRPVIIISAKSEMESLKRCYNLEADHYITKPFTVDDLVRGVKVMISLIPARME